LPDVPESPGGKLNLSLFTHARQKLLLEVFESRQELLESLVVGIFFDNVMEKTEADDQFLAVLLSHLTCLFKFSYHIGKIMMTSEIKVRNFPYFTVNYFSNVEMVRFFVRVHKFRFFTVYCLQ